MWSHPQSIAKSLYINFPTRSENLRENYFAHFFDDENKLKILSEIKPPLREIVSTKYM